MTRSDVHHHFNGVLFGMFMRRFGRLCMGLFLGGGDRCLWLMLRRRVLLLLTYYGGDVFFFGRYGIIYRLYGNLYGCIYIIG